MKNTQIMICSLIIINVSIAIYLLFQKQFDQNKINFTDMCNDASTRLKRTTDWINPKTEFISHDISKRESDTEETAEEVERRSYGAILT